MIKMMKLKFVRILIFTFISEKMFVFKAHFNGWGKSLFARIYIDDVFAYGTAYLSNDPGSSFFGALPGGRLGYY